MTEQLVQPKAVTQRLILVVLAMVLTILVGILGWYVHRLSDPYVREVLTLDGDGIKGELMFEINCAGCHGIRANGSVGPSLHHIHNRKSKISIIYQVTSGQTPPMPKFQPTYQEMADLLVFLETL